MKQDKMRLLLTGIVLVLLGGIVSAATVRAQEAFTVAITSEEATVNRFGIVTVTGTVTCSEPATIIGLFVNVTQPVGRTRSILGSAGITEPSGECGEATPFALQVPGLTGRFGPGIAYFSVFVEACIEEFLCEGGQEFNKVLRVRRLPKR